MTALYDLGRERADGRSLDSYIEWLKATCKILPNITVFTDIKEVAKVLPEHAVVVDLNFSEFDMYVHREKVADICARMSRKSKVQDITIRLPDYAIFQFGKFQLLDLASQMGSEEYLVWVDAGISRFTRAVEPRVVPDVDALFAAIGDADALFEVDFRQNTRLGKLRLVKTGTFRRTFSGTAFAISKEATSNYRRLLSLKALSWLEQHTWDNEQVALNQLFHSHDISPALAEQDEVTGTILRIFQGISKPRTLAPSNPSYQKLRKKRRSS